VVLILTKHVKYFYGIIFPSRALKEREEVAPAPKYSLTISLFDGIRKLKVKDTQAQQSLAIL
jgi:hypothetical protein